jgi:hypothetical protein
MVGYDDTNNALTLGDDDSLEVGDYELKYNSTDDEWHAEYGRPIGGELGNHGDIVDANYISDSAIGENAISIKERKESGVDIGTSQLPTGDAARSISLWHKTPSSTSDRGQVFSSGNSGTATETFDFEVDGYNDNNAADAYTIHCWSSYASTGADEVIYDEWTHIVVTYSGGGLNDTNVSFYVNGTEVPVAFSSGDTLSTVYGEARFGADLDNNNSNPDVLQRMDLDDARIYDKELTSSEVSTLFNGGNVTSGLLHHYTFEYPETPDTIIDVNGDIYPQNSVPRSTSGSLVPQGLAESVSAGEALADDGNTYSSVQTAVDNASGWVFVGPGTFNESVTISTAGLTLEGCGYDTLIDGGASNATTVNAANVTIRNMSLQTTGGGGNSVFCVAADTNADSTIVEGVKILDSDQRGVSLTTGTDHIVRNCVSVDTDDEAFRVGERSMIIGCVIQGTSSNNGIAAGSDSIIANNVVSNTANNAIDLFDDDDMVIIGNRTISPGGSGIQIGGTSTDNIVANNRCSGGGISDSGTGTVLDDNLTGPSN